MLIKNKQIQDLATLIKDTVFENKVFLVGGAVRDILMGTPTHDFDFVVIDHGIDGGIKLAKMLKDMKKAHSFIMFPRFGTASILFGKDDMDFEFVAPRKEEYVEGSRKPKVVEGTLDDDIYRRDFTINSMLINISTGDLIDKVGGIKDIEDKVIRTTSDPKVIFKEDPLRIMRAIRFSARFGFKPELDVMVQISENVRSLRFISNERIRDEFIKILMDDSFREGLTLLKNTGVLAYLIPAFSKVILVDNPGKFHTKNLFDHLLDVVEKTEKTPEHRLAALLHDIGKVHTMKKDEDGVHFHGHSTVSAKIANGFMTKYKFSNESKDMVVTAVEKHMDFWENVNTKRLRREHSKLGMKKLLFVFDLIRADSKHIDRVIAVDKMVEIIKTDELINNPPLKPIVDGNEIMERYNLKPSKLVGELLEAVRDMMFEDPTVTRDEVFSELDSMMGEG